MVILTTWSRRTEHAERQCKMITFTPGILAFILIVSSFLPTLMYLYFFPVKNKDNKILILQTLFIFSGAMFFAGVEFYIVTYFLGIHHGYWVTAFSQIFAVTFVFAKCVMDSVIPNSHYNSLSSFFPVSLIAIMCVALYVLFFYVISLMIGLNHLKV
jgi:hypothetical protein